MKYRILLGLLVICSTIFAREKRAIDQESMAVISAKKGFVETLAHNFTFMILRDVDQDVVVFTHKPKRQAWLIRTKQFVADWNALFPYTNGNAAVVVSKDRSRGNKSIPVILYEPVYYSHMQAIRFRVEYLDPKMRFPVGNIGDVAIFVESEKNLVLSPL